eukprot:jgi/Picsp_1/6024/NSC_03378-R1_protein
MDESGIDADDLGVGKKRKNSCNNGERSSYASFVAAANALSQLYSQTVQREEEQKKMGSREALLRLSRFIAEVQVNGQVSLGDLEKYIQMELLDLE